MKFDGLKYRLSFRIEEIIVAFVLLLNLLDFLKLLNPELDFIKKVISWTGFGYFIYKAGLSGVFFGERSKFFDGSLVIAYFLLIVNKFVYFSEILFKELAESGIKKSYDVIVGSNLQIIELVPKLVTTSILGFFTSLGELIRYYFLAFLQAFLNNGIFIEQLCFYIGGSLILILALSVYFKDTRIKNPCILGIFIVDDYLEDESKNNFRKFFFSFIVMTGFFVLVFNLVVEWLVLTADSPLFMIAVFSYIYLVIKHKSSFNVESMLFKIASFGDKFYEKFVEQFKYKEQLLIGLLGILVLHLLPDIGNYMTPYLFGVENGLYFDNLGVAEDARFLLPLLLSNISSVSLILDKISIALIYALNSIAMLFLIILPAYAWYVFYKKKEFTLPSYVLALFLSSMTAFFLMPLYSLNQISSNNLLGVVILINPLTDLSNVMQSMIISALVFFLVLALSYFARIKAFFAICASVISSSFFGLYLYYFFTGAIMSYWPSIKHFLSVYDIFGFVFFSLFMMLSLFFYVLGFIGYIYELYMSFTKKFI